MVPKITKGSRKSSPVINEYIKDKKPTTNKRIIIIFLNWLKKICNFVLLFLSINTFRPFVFCLFNTSVLDRPFFDVFNSVYISSIDF